MLTRELSIEDMFFAFSDNFLCDMFLDNDFLLVAYELLAFVDLVTDFLTSIESSLDY